MKKVNKLMKFASSYMIPSILKNIYLMIKYKCVIHPSARILFLKYIKIGKGTIIGKCDIIAQGHIEIGKECIINDHVILNSKSGYIKIGNHSSVNPFAIIFGSGGTEIGNYTGVGPGTKIINNHLIPKKGQDYRKMSERLTKIGDYVLISANVVIVDGVTINDNAVIGANAFVNKDIPEGAVANGIPARVIQFRR